ncbi:MAG: hypothetical protein ACOYOM_14275, partial [Chloroflexota bacterium]
MTTTSAKRSASQSGAMGAPSGPRASLPASLSGVGEAKRSVYKSSGDGGTVRSAGIPAQRVAPFGCRQDQAKRIQITGDGGTVRTAGIPAQRLAPFGCRRGQAKHLQISGDGGTVRSAGIPAQRLAPFG